MADVGPVEPPAAPATFEQPLVAGAVTSSSVVGPVVLAPVSGSLTTILPYDSKTTTYPKAI